MAGIPGCQLCLSRTNWNNHCGKRVAEELLFLQIQQSSFEAAFE